MNRVTEGLVHTVCVMGWASQRQTLWRSWACRMFIGESPGPWPLWEEAGPREGQAVMQTEWWPPLTPCGAQGLGCPPQSCLELARASSTSGWGLFWGEVSSQPGSSVKLRPPWKDWPLRAVCPQHSELLGTQAVPCSALHAVAINMQGLETHS